MIAYERQDILQHLGKLGLVPGALVEVEEKAPLNGPVVVTVGNSRFAPGRNIASVIWG